MLTRKSSNQPATTATGRSDAPAMPAQFADLQGLDHGGQRQRCEGPERSPHGLEPAAELPGGSGLARSVTRPVRADGWKDSLAAQPAEASQGVDVAVFVLDRQGRVVMPRTEKCARLLPQHGRAGVHRLVPMVIRLTGRHVADCEGQVRYLKASPGSKTTGRAPVRAVQAVDAPSGGNPVGRGNAQPDDAGPTRPAELRTEVPRDVKAGVYRARMAVRAPNSFHIQTWTNGVSPVIQGISHRRCQVVQYNDGYGYFLNRAICTGRDQARPKAADASHPLLCLPGMHAGASRASR